MKGFIHNNIDDLVEKLARFIEIPSVYATPTETAPFGTDVDRALHYVLDLAESFNLETVNHEGYVGEVRASNDESKNPEFIIGILCHVDVVEGGDHWETDPFKATIKDGRIYGRGALDDKGPAISCLYGLKYLKEEKLIPKGVEIRMILGTNEEMDWDDMTYYLDHVSDLPDMSIVPDASFPMINCEKGLLDFDLSWEDTSHPSESDLEIVKLSGGTARNVVPAKAVCHLTINSAVDKQAILEQINAHEGAAGTFFDDYLEITTTGKSVHCMTPEKGVNAISLLMQVLYDLGDITSHRQFIHNYHQHIGNGYHGEKMGLDFQDDISGRLTFNVGECQLTDHRFTLISNLRYPASMQYDEIIQAMKSFIQKSSFTYMEKDHLMPIYHEADTPLIQSLFTAYQKVTGDTASKGIAIGGATYARALPNAVAFGPLFPDEDELAHEPNEFIRIDRLAKMTEIYIIALKEIIKNAEMRG